MATNARLHEAGPPLLTPVDSDRPTRYTLLKKIASGGMAEVFLARQHGSRGFSRIVVVKKLLPHLAENERFVRMFLDEAHLSAQLNHPNVVSLYELVVEP